MEFCDVKTKFVEFANLFLKGVAILSSELNGLSDRVPESVVADPQSNTRHNRVYSLLQSSAGSKVHKFTSDIGRGCL